MEKASQPAKNWNALNGTSGTIKLTLNSQVSQDDWTLEDKALESNEKGIPAGQKLERSGLPGVGRGSRIQRNEMTHTDDLNIK